MNKLISTLLLLTLPALSHAQSAERNICSTAVAAAAMMEGAAIEKSES